MAHIIFRGGGYWLTVPPYVRTFYRVRALNDKKLRFLGWAASELQAKSMMRNWDVLNSTTDTTFFVAEVQITLRRT